MNFLRAKRYNHKKAVINFFIIFGVSLCICYLGTLYIVYNEVPLVIVDDGMVTVVTVCVGLILPVPKLFKKLDIKQKVAVLIFSLLVSVLATCQVYYEEK